MVKENFIIVMSMLKELIEEHESRIEKLYEKTSPAPTMINPKVLNCMLDDLSNLLASKRRLNHAREILLIRAASDSIETNEDIGILETEMKKTSELIDAATQTLKDATALYTVTYNNNVETTTTDEKKLEDKEMFVDDEKVETEVLHPLFVAPTKKRKKRVKK